MNEQEHLWITEGHEREMPVIDAGISKAEKLPREEIIGADIDDLDIVLAEGAPEKLKGLLDEKENELEIAKLQSYDSEEIRKEVFAKIEKEIEDLRKLNNEIMPRLN